MSLFEKIIIPLIDENLVFGDVSPFSGFIDSYTSDPDKPCGDNCVYLTYDDSVRTEDSMRCATRLEKLSTVQCRYIKMINGKPVMVYKMYIKPEIKKLFSGVVELTPEQVVRIIDFWGYTSDTAFYICSNKHKSVTVEHDMPLEEFIPRFG